MTEEYKNALNKLKIDGWAVKLQTNRQSFPIEIKARYPWVPSDVEGLVVEIYIASNPGESIWLLGIADFLGLSESAFKWNEWELLSLDAAEGDPVWSDTIKLFWDEHFPIATSVKSGYSYFAIRKSDLSIVAGEGPEFEETRVVAASYLEFLNTLSSQKGNNLLY